MLGVPTLARLVELVQGAWTPRAACGAGERSPAAARASSTWPTSAARLDAKRALEIAAAGGHNLLMIGPPGAGKTMLARRLPGILPPPTFDEALEITRIHSVAGLGRRSPRRRAPVPRAASHDLARLGWSAAAATPRPGEITLAHRGVLFLDELAEFSRPALEALRQPLEEGRVVDHARAALDRVPGRGDARGRLQRLPVRAAAATTATADQVDRARYARRLSGPLLDRIDLICQLDAGSAAGERGRAPTERLCSGPRAGVSGAGAPA